MSSEERIVVSICNGYPHKTRRYPGGDILDGKIYSEIDLL